MKAVGEACRRHASSQASRSRARPIVGSSIGFRQDWAKPSTCTSRMLAEPVARQFRADPQRPLPGKGRLRPLHRPDHRGQAPGVPAADPGVRNESFPLLAGRKQGAPVQARIGDERRGQKASRPKLNDLAITALRWRWRAAARPRSWPSPFTSTTRPCETPASAWMMTCAVGGVLEQLLEAILERPELDRFPLGHQRCRPFSTATGKSRACACSSFAAPLEGRRARRSRPPAPAPPRCCSRP